MTLLVFLDKVFGCAVFVALDVVFRLAAIVVFLVVCQGAIEGASAPFYPAVAAGLARFARATWTVWHDFDAISTL